MPTSRCEVLSTPEYRTYRRVRENVGCHRGQTGIEKTVSGEILFNVTARVRATITKNAETLFFGDERGVDSNLCLLSLRLFAALCIFALRIQSGERTRGSRLFRTY